jgi:hypothetical protein
MQHVDRHAIVLKRRCDQKTSNPHSLRQCLHRRLHDRGNGVMIVAIASRINEDVGVEDREGKAAARRSPYDRGPRVRPFYACADDQD